MLGRIAALALALTLLSGGVLSAEDASMRKAEHDEIVSGGRWHFHSIPCVDGFVATVTPRLANAGQKVFTAADYEQSGVEVTFKIPPYFHFGSTTDIRQAAVVHYQNEPENALMRAERPGDKVQICLKGFPTPTYSADDHRFICDPDKDPRGFTFRVYDYGRKAAYYGLSSEHACGGA
jgi:hypothetical protein